MTLLERFLSQECPSNIRQHIFEFIDDGKKGGLKRVLNLELNTIDLEIDLDSGLVQLQDVLDADSREQLVLKDFLGALNS